jgi:hypothetical protein
MSRGFTRIVPRERAPFQNIQLLLRQGEQLPDLRAPQIPRLDAEITAGQRQFDTLRPPFRRLSTLTIDLVAQVVDEPVRVAPDPAQGEERFANLPTCHFPAVYRDPIRAPTNLDTHDLDGTKPDAEGECADPRAADNAYDGLGDGLAFSCKILPMIGRVSSRLMVQALTRP